MARLLGRGPLLGGLASRSPLGRLLRWRPLLGCLACRSPLLGRLASRSPLDGLPGRGPLHGLLGRRALLRCLPCGGPLFRGLLGRGPSLRGYCHRCTSLGAWSLNRGEACATPRPTTPRRAHCRTGFTLLTTGVTLAATSVLIPRAVASDQHAAGTTGAARKANRQLSLCAPHIVVSQHISTLPHTSGTHILLLSTCSGQAFFVCAVILRSSMTFDSHHSHHTIEVLAAPVRAQQRLVVA